MDQPTDKGDDSLPHLTWRELAEKLRISERTLRRLHKRGFLKNLRIGRHRHSGDFPDAKHD